MILKHSVTLTVNVERDSEAFDRPLMDERQLDTRALPLGCDKGREIAGFGLKWAAEGCRSGLIGEKDG